MPIQYLDETPGTITYLDEEPAPVIPPPVAPPIRDWRAAAAAQMQPLGAPVGLPERPAREEPLETPEEQAKRAALAAEKRRVKGTGRLQELDLAAAKGLQTGAQILSRIFPTTAITDVAQRIGLRPIVPPEHVKEIREGVTAAIEAVVPRAQVPVDAPSIISPELGEKINKGLTEFGDETLSSFTSPEQAALLASGATSPQVVGRLFQLGSILSVPEATQQLKEAVKSGDAKQITKAGAGLGMSLAIPAAIERGLTPKPAPPIPPVMPRVEPPRGVTVPERPPTVTETTPVVPEAKPAPRMNWPQVYKSEHETILDAQRRMEEARSDGDSALAAEARRERDDALSRLDQFDTLTKEEVPRNPTVEALRDNPRLSLSDAEAAGKQREIQRVADEAYDAALDAGKSKEEAKAAADAAIGRTKPAPTKLPPTEPTPAPPTPATPAAAPENGSVVYRVPATGKSKTFIKWNGQWFKSKGGVTTGKPLDPDIGLTRALEAQLAKQQAKPPAPPPAAAKVETEVRKVAVTQGQRPAKEVKSELVSRLEAAVTDAQFSTDDYFPGLYVKKDKLTLTDRAVENTQPLKDWLESKTTSGLIRRDTETGAKLIGEALERKKVSKVTIDIPGDGSFTVWNTKDNLQNLLERAKKISTKPGEAVKFKKRTGFPTVPGEIKTTEDWGNAVEFFELKQYNTIADRSNALADLAKRVNPEKPETVTVSQVDNWIEERRKAKSKMEAAEYEATPDIPPPQAAPAIPEPPKGAHIVTILKPDGTTEVGAVDPSKPPWTFPDGRIVPYIARPNPLRPGEWSHGMLREGEKIIEPETPPAAPLAPGPGAQTIGEPRAKAQIEELEEAFRNISGLRVPVAEKIQEAFNVGERVSGAKTAVGKAIAGLKASGDYLIRLWKGVPKIDELLRSKGELSAEVEKRGWHVRKFIKTAAAAVPRAQDQAAIAKWIDAGGDAATLQRGLAEAPDKYKQAYRDALNLKGDLLISAQNAQNYFEARLQEAIDAGVLKEGVEDYLHRIYERTPERAERAIAYVQSALLKPNPSLARKRVFQWDWEAEKLGYRPVQSFIPRIAHYEASLSKAIASRQFIKRATEMKASDGRPVIDIKGVGIPLEDASGVREGTLIKPSFNPQRNTQPTLPDGTPNPNYRGDYVNREYPSLSRWKWAASDTAGNPIFVQGDVAIHPEFVGRVDSLLRPSLLRTGKQAKIFRPLMGVSSTFKQTMLDLSGFHQVQITVHGLEHRVWALPTGAAPPGFAKIIKDIDFADPNVDGLLRGGITLGGEHYMPYREGLIGSALTRHVPILGPLTETYHNWLFQDYIPRIKMTMALHALERNRARYAGKMTDEQILFKTASEANAAFGELNYTMLERSQTARDISRLIMLAPDFLEARARFAGAAFQRGGKMFGHEQRTALLLGALTMWLTARVINKMISGQYHDEPENAFSIVVNGKSYGLRTVQGDIMHAATKPVEFIMHRLNPVYTRIFVELAAGRDEFGRKRTPLEAVWDTVSNIRPIALRSSRERNLWESISNAFGITARRYNEVDRAFKLAQAWKSKHGVQERGEFIYDPQKDPLRSLKLALVQNDDAGATAEIKRLLESKLVNRVNLNEYFSRYATMPFTGSKANDTKFEATLSQDEHQTVDAAREHKKQINRLYRKALEKYDAVRSTGGAPPAGKVTYLD